jgi:hypothetical protein
MRDIPIMAVCSNDDRTFEPVSYKSGVIVTRLPKESIGARLRGLLPLRARPLGDIEKLNLAFSKCTEYALNYDPMEEEV